ncbi:MAG: outer membrane lipoprotein carrier protein LolA [Verrucomicrobiota bacterium]|jgi:outer membrane lipoprotein-sorting protein
MVSLRAHLAGGEKISRARAVFFALCVFFASQSLRAAGIPQSGTVLDAWFAAQKNLQTWSADFVQTRVLQTLTQPLVATGHVWFAMPDQFRWELGRPARTIAVRHDDEMLVIYPLLKRAERYPMGANAPREWRDAMSLLQAGFPHNRKEFESQFQLLSLVETNGLWQFALQPKSRFARQMMTELRITLATNNFSLTATELVFVDGSRMRNDFTNAVLNPALDQNFSEWQPPPDYTVTEPLKQ